MGFLDLAVLVLQSSEYAPCNTQGLPVASVAAFWPSALPVPPASMPMISTDWSPMKGWNMPMAFEPPPTQEMTASGSLPVRSSICARASLPITVCSSRTRYG